ncbi:ATP synthase-coupling factor 6 mitochondrial [Trinorchestia longiramus]|nr:ATP synthase-coupling factor 6 mitochondrial [Trinorchestia longiramus]
MLDGRILVLCNARILCRASGGKLVDATPQLEKQLQQELDKVAKQYGGGAGIDMTKFPSFKFEEPTIDGQISQA